MLVIFPLQTLGCANAGVNHRCAAGWTVSVSVGGNCAKASLSSQPRLVLVATLQLLWLASRMLPPAGNVRKCGGASSVSYGHAAGSLDSRCVLAVHCLSCRMIGMVEFHALAEHVAFWPSAAGCVLFVLVVANKCLRFFCTLLEVPGSASCHPFAVLSGGCSASVTCSVVFLVESFLSETASRVSSSVHDLDKEPPSHSIGEALADFELCLGWRFVTHRAFACTLKTWLLPAYTGPSRGRR